MPAIQTENCLVGGLAYKRVSEANICFRTETETVIHSDNGFATVAYLRIKKAKLEDKLNKSPEPIIPTLLDAHFVELEEKLSQAGTVGVISGTIDAVVSEMPSEPSIQAPTHHERHHWVAIGQVQCRTLQNNLTIEEEVHECFQQLQGMFVILLEHIL